MSDWEYERMSFQIDSDMGLLKKEIDYVSGLDVDATQYEQPKSLETANTDKES